ncbi:MAG: hypothetical protein KA716_25960 [Gloeotrichia echinulata DEX184]|nr:hypothetical protein [Gloeotrichia echinulata DEX184]
MSRQIKDLLEKTTLDDTDWLLVQESSGSCKKISRSNLVKNLATNSSVPTTTPYQMGMDLWLEGGELADKSGNGRNAVASGARLPYKIKAFGGRDAFYWDGQNNQQLQVPFFLPNATGVTMYVVYSANCLAYNLVRTRAIDDWYRFNGDGNGYFGAFRNTRLEAYPAAMPSTGDHLLTIHSSASVYEVTLDRVSSGTRSGSFNAGDRFLIGVNGFNYVGAIGLILVYPNIHRSGQCAP